MRDRAASRSRQAVSPGRSARFRLASFGRHRGGHAWEEHGLMADLAFAVLLIAGFGVLVLTLRGLAKL
jgi:hypothetical protein